jgi:hypothetical protein
MGATPPRSPARREPQSAVGDEKPQGAVPSGGLGTLLNSMHDFLPRRRLSDARHKREAARDRP